MCNHHLLSELQTSGSKVKTFGPLMHPMPKNLIPLRRSAINRRVNVETSGAQFADVSRIRRIE